MEDRVPDLSSGGWWWVAQQNWVTPSPFELDFVLGLWTWTLIVTTVSGNLSTCSESLLTPNQFPEIFSWVGTIVTPQSSPSSVCRLWSSWKYYSVSQRNEILKMIEEINPKFYIFHCRLWVELCFFWSNLLIYCLLIPEPRD